MTGKDPQDDSDEELNLDTVFPEPERPPSPDPTIATFERRKGASKGNWSKVDVHLVGSHPLWGHFLWNAAKSFSNYLDEHPDLYEGGNVLELGAGGGLPGLVTLLNGARNLVTTDYPDFQLLRNLEKNVDVNVPQNLRDQVSVLGYIWGADVRPLFEALKPKSEGQVSEDRFDLLILSDLIFNHSQHNHLLTTCEATLRKEPVGGRIPTILVFYSSHKPDLRHKDLQFFEDAKARGWFCEKIVTEKFQPMFENDAGDAEIRATVEGWRMTRSPSTR